TSTYVRADTDCRLLVVGRNTLWRLFEESPSFARNFIRVFPRRLAHLHKILRAVQQLHEEYKQQSTTDPLTGLYNRRWLEDSLSFELSRCQLRRRPLSLLMVDIDHFKRYNDDHGHMAGDEALKAVARAVLVALRGSDLAVRYGGEEIVVILPGVDLRESERVAERLHHAVAAARILGADGRVLPAVTVSIGVAQMVAENTPEQLLAQVDQALYRAKRQGRNCTSA
ncbi:MAG: diguanylate cyclase, partial [Thiohalocapsa sp.]